jgi:aspartate 1-decarboxylase
LRYKGDVHDSLQDDGRASHERGAIHATGPRGEGKAMRWLMRSKIHNATVTEANLAYIGSITIDEDLMDRVELWRGERVLVVSNTSGARLETYVIAGERGSGSIAMNGAAAHLIGLGEQVIIMGFELCAAPIQPRAALVDHQNRFVRFLHETPDTVIASAVFGSL